MKIKVITGFRDDQFYTIDLDEAHKAYYLFMNPEQRGVFNNGVALVGKNIQGIEPDYNATMGWNTTHKIDADDLNEIKKKKVDYKLKDGLAKAKEVAKLIEADGTLAGKKLSDIQLISDSAEVKQITNGFKPKAF